MTTVDTTYGPYAQDPGYIAANAALIDGIDLRGVTLVADLACGTGLLSQLLLQRAPDLAICGIDLDPVQIAIAQRNLAAAGAVVVDPLAALRARAAAGQGAVHLRADSAMSLPFASGEVDLVVMGNAIHMMPDRPAFLTEVARVLRPGGRLVFNSVFYVGTFVPGSESVFSEWMKEAVLVLGELNAERQAAGLPAVPRQRGMAGRAFQKDWLSAAGWAEALAAAGLDVTASSDRPVPISRHGLELVGSYGGLAEVLMSGYPVEIASLCLQRGAARAFDRLGIAEVPRNWLEVTARRNQADPVGDTPGGIEAPGSHLQ